MRTLKSLSSLHLILIISSNLFFSKSTCFIISRDSRFSRPYARSHHHPLISRYGPQGYYHNNNGHNFETHERSSAWNISGSVRDFASSAKAKMNSYRNVAKVDDHGAKGDGRADDTEAFEKAWKVACSSQRGVFLVPSNGIYRLKPITFSGPCKSTVKVKIYGKIKASDDPSDYERSPTQWLVFENLDNLRVEGGGSIHGNGKKWWLKSCKVDSSQPCKVAPTALTFYNSNNLRVADLNLKDAQQMHLVFQNCDNVRATNLRITAPESSPNTDGIHVAGTTNILIDDSRIQTGDDCISIVSGSRNVEAANIECGPGHGISIGSLGADNCHDYVSDVYVHGAKLSGTTNGVRIKTWQGGSGYAKDIKFQNIVMTNVTNPIIIDQNYCDRDEPCHEQRSAVQVKNVVYQNIRGTSASDVAMKFDCSKTHPCQQISLQAINLIINHHQLSKTAEAASCVNVKFQEDSMVLPNCQ